MTETRKLLARYVEDGSESAFRQLVEGYIDLVYSTALRLVQGDSHRAEDVTQMVFVRLTEKAKTLAGDVSLGGWLHRDTCHVAATLMRGERRRQIRERQAAEMNALQDDTNLDSVLPVLDDAINQLADQDREAIILRFFEQQNFRALAAAVGGSEDAARMRVNRALEKLHGLLKSRGVALSLAGLGTLLGAKAVAAAPVGLAAAVASGVGSGTAAGAGGTIARTAAKGWKFAAIPGAALILTVAVGVYFGNRAAEKSSAPPPSKISAAATPPAIVAEAKTIKEPTTSAATTAVSSGMRFQALDANSGAPVAGAKLHVAYFRDGGEGKSAELETGADGSVQVDFPQFPYTGVNLFVSAAGHVPLVTSWHDGNMPTNYTMKLPVGTVAGGTVLDEARQPVANAKVEFYASGGIDRAKKENIQYLNDATSQRTDADGRWSSDMMPANFEKIGVIVTHPDYALISTQLVVNTATAADSVMVMKPGTLIFGVVTDRAGEPIAGAKIKEIQNRMEPKRSAKTDADGRFELKHMNPGELELAVESDGFAPVSRDTVVSNETLELKFELEHGHVFRGCIVDDNGVPITNAMAQTDWDNQGLRRFAWSVRTDDQGRFEWNSAPADPVLYWFEAPGFTAIRGRLLKADGTDQEIKLTRLQSTPAHPALRITGTVSDEDTGQPLDDFKVMIADRVFGDFPPEFSYGTDGTGGVFELRWRPFPGDYRIQIQKDGYVPVASTNLLGKDGDQTLAFSLHRDKGINGTVSLPNGQPAADATVFLYELQGSVYMDKPGAYRADVSPKLRVQTGKDGKFSFATKLQACGLIVVHDQGYADVSLPDFDGKIALQAWGRVEGKLMMGGSPAAGQTVVLGNMMHHATPSANMRHFPALSLWLSATTGPDGGFVFEKVPPGERKIAQRLVRTAAGNGRLYDTQGGPVNVAAGTVTYVELGGHGQLIKGRAAFSGTTATPIKWSEVAVELTLKIPGVPVAPKSESFSSPAASQAAWTSFANADRAFWASDAGREADRAQRSYTAYCNEDGSFSIPDVPSGQYNLKIEIRQRGPMAINELDGKEVGALETEINIPETPANEHPVLDLGALEVPVAK